MRKAGLCCAFRSSRVLAAALLVLGGCQTTDSVAPRATDAPCSGGASLQLAPLGVASLDCSAGTTVALAGGGASYLVAATLAAGDVPANQVDYTLSVPSTAVYSSAPVADVLQATPVPAGRAAPGAERWAPGPLARAFDTALRARGAALARSAPSAGGPVPVAPEVGPPARAVALGTQAGSAAQTAASATPALGSVRTFQVLATTDFNHERYASVTARLEFAGANVLLYVDQGAPADGFSDAELQRFGAYYDQVLYPLDLAAFGPPSDIDGNGRLIMLLTPVVNALVTAAQCASQGYVGGFFNPVDLSSTGSTSNRGEVFYAIVPDPTASRSCAHGVADTEALLGSTFLHELQHLISYSQHVLVHHGQADSGWLDEGLSLVAEELGAVFYEAKYPPPLGRSAPGQPLPDSALPFLANAVPSAYQYLARTDTTSLTTHSDADFGLAWRGGDWLLLRWLGTQKGGAAFYKTLEQSALTGVADIQAAATEPFPALFGDFALALYADSLPGIARSAVPTRNGFGTTSLRRLFAASGSPTFPLEPSALTGSVTSTLVPGAVALYRIHTTQGSTALTLRFATPGGAPLPAGLRPQLAIMRLP